MGDTHLPCFDFLKSRPDLSADFDAYMESQTVMHSGSRIDHLLQGFAWATLKKTVMVAVILIHGIWYFVFFLLRTGG